MPRAARAATTRSGRSTSPPTPGKTIELALTYASDDIVAYPGVFVDDITGPAGAGTTSFEDDGNTLDGWTTPGAPAGSEPNPNDWTVGTIEIAPEPLGPVIDGSLAQQPEVLDFLASIYGRYPFSTSGGIVDVAPIGFALENQTRPIYSTAFFTDPVSGEDVVVHELAHQWAGDDVTIARWRDIWLNEGFATYAEWMWSEADGRDTAQELLRQLRQRHPGGRSVLERRHRPSAVRGPALRHLHLLARRDDAACAPHADRRRGLLPPHAHVVPGAARRPRDDRGVHRDGGTGESPAARRPVRRWLFTPEKPAGIETASAARSALVSRPAGTLGRIAKR